MRLIDGDKLVLIFKQRREVWRGNGVLPSNESFMWNAAMDITANVPTIDAVPLDKLCALLAKNADCPPEHSHVQDHCKENCAKCWKSVLKEWMEEQNGTKEST